MILLLKLNKSAKFISTPKIIITANEKLAKCQKNV